MNREGSQVHRCMIDAGHLSAALRAVEDGDVEVAAAGVAEIERQAARLGDDLLRNRARLCQVSALMREGDLAGAARRIRAVFQWTVDHDAVALRARVHLVWADLHRLLGDPARCLEHSIHSVELLDEQAPPQVQISHRAKLADALGLAGSLDAARLRYAQTEDLCRRLGAPRELIGVLHRHAQTEFRSGEPGRAQAVTQRLRAVATRHGLDLEPAVLGTIGAIEINAGLFAEAAATLRECLERHRCGRPADDAVRAGYLLMLARAERGLGRVQSAQARLDAARALCAGRRLGEVLVRVHQEQAELHAVRGEFAEAFAVHKVLLAAYDDLQSTQRAAQAQACQAILETTEARQEAERFREQARRDPLTGLRNRRYVDEQLPGLIKSDPALTVAIVDLDHFKRINDALSHNVGDQVLIRVAALLEAGLAAVTPDGFVARLGGEEFLLVLPRTTVPVAARCLDGIRRAVRSHAWEDIAHGLRVTLSVGVARVTDAVAATQSGVLSAADRNLYAAKHGGRDRVVSGAQDGRFRSPAA